MGVKLGLEKERKRAANNGLIKESNTRHITNENAKELLGIILSWIAFKESQIRVNDTDFNSEDETAVLKSIGELLVAGESKVVIWEFLERE